MKRSLFGRRERKFVKIFLQLWFSPSQDAHKLTCSFIIVIIGETIPGSAQGLILALCSETTPGRLKELYGMLGIKLRSATCKANALRAVLHHSGPRLHSDCPFQALWFGKIAFLCLK